MRIAFLDSGVGGISVLAEALELMPGADYVYYADVENAPYGTKNKTKVRKAVFRAVEHLAAREIDGLVIACNTATSIAVRDLRQEYDFPIIGMEPAVKPAVEQTGEGRVLVLATALTIKEDKYRRLVERLDGEDIVDSLALSRLVEYAENFVYEKDVILPYLEQKFSAYDLGEYGTVVLGCTHFPLYRNFFRRVLPGHIDIIDGNRGTIRYLRQRIKEEYSAKKVEEIGPGRGKGEINFFFSGRIDEDRTGQYLGLLDRVREEVRITMEESILTEGEE
ncbi:MAG: glutamate racemase [Bacillota bacterium]